METTTLEMSMADKLHEAFNLSIDLLYPHGTSQEPIDIDSIYGEKIADKIWGYADGLEQKYHFKRMAGQCSLQASIDYDIGEAEKQIEVDIQQFKELLEKRHQKQNSYGRRKRGGN